MRYSYRPGVAGAIVGTRLGLKDHSDDNKRVFSLRLDDEDRSRLVSNPSPTPELILLILPYMEYRITILPYNDITV